MSPAHRPKRAAAARKPVFDTVAIVGFGHIGSSIARALRASGGARRILAVDRSAAVRRKLRTAPLAQEQLADEVLASAARLPEVDLLLLAAPLSAYETIFRQAAPRLKKGAVVSDVGSVKQPVLRLARLLPEPKLLVPGHPVAGTERSGPESGFAELFQGRYCLLTPAPNADPRAVSKVARLWRGFGAHINLLSAKQHDRALGLTSHLPHAVAYALVAVAAARIERAGKGGDDPTAGAVVRYAAGGFRDFTRIAASDPVMWRDVFLENRDELLRALREYRLGLDTLTDAVSDGDGEALLRTFTATRRLRHAIERAGQAGSFDAREPRPAAGNNARKNLAAPRAQKNAAPARRARTSSLRDDDAPKARKNGRN